MDTWELQPLLNNYHRKLASVDTHFLRYLYAQIRWEGRVIGIRGARGVGKTTMLLQHILLNYEDVDKTLYASLDDLWFSAHSLLELVDWADQHGLGRLYLDEVHRYGRWAETLKNIYDSYPRMSIVYTSSSLLLMDSAQVDLSRRQTLYTLHGMSFREYLAFEGVMDEPAVALEDLLRGHVGMAMRVVGRAKVATHFEAYLHHGYYPFYKEAGEDYGARLRETVSVVMENDLPAVERMTYETIQKVKRLLLLISEHVPFQPNMSELWKQLATNNELGLKMLYALERAKILTLLTTQAKSYKALCKPAKILLGNTNLMHALCPRVDIGNERETFFVSQLAVHHHVTHPHKGDCLVDGRYLFEVGGRQKTFDQIADKEESFLALADTEVGHGPRIPLWLFGFVY